MVANGELANILDEHKHRDVIRNPFEKGYDPSKDPNPPQWEDEDKDKKPQQDMGMGEGIEVREIA